MRVCDITNDIMDIMFTKRALGLLSLLIVIILLTRVSPNNLQNSKSTVQPVELFGNELIFDLYAGPSDNQKISGIYAYNPENRNERPYLIIDSAASPKWSPNRKYISCSFGDNIYVFNRNCEIEDATRYLSVRANAVFESYRWDENSAIVLSQSFGSAGIIEAFLAHKYHDWNPHSILSQNILAVKKINNTEIDPDKSRCVRTMVKLPGIGRSLVQIGPLLPHSSDQQDKLYIYDEQIGTSRFNALKPLTDNSSAIRETKPIISPDNEWIAYSYSDKVKLIDAIAICKVDGTKTALLPIEKLWSILDPCRYTLGKWFDVDKIESRETISNYQIVDIAPAEWSDDGKYLLIRVVGNYSHNGSDFCNILAKNDSGKWKVRCTYSYILGPVKNGQHWAFTKLPSPAVSTLELETVPLTIQAWQIIGNIEGYQIMSADW